MPDTRRAGGRVGAGGRPGAAAQHGGDPRAQCFFNLLRANIVDVRIHPTCGQDLTFACDHFGSRADDYVNPVLHVGVSGLADGGYVAIFQSDISFDDPPVIQYHAVGDHGINRLGAADLRLTHAVADRFAAAKLNLITVSGEVALDLDEQLGIGEADLIADRRAVHLGIGLFADFHD